MTEERLDRLFATFNQMKANGVDVEVVVDHRDDAEAVVGNTVAMSRTNGALNAAVEMKGERGITLAQTVKNVSVMIDQDFKDGQNRSYGEAITHIAIVVCPQ